MAKISKVHRSNKLHSNKSLKRSFTNIQINHPKFVDCELALVPNFLDIFALCETNMEDLIDSRNFFVRAYLPLIQSVTQAGL